MCNTAYGVQSDLYLNCQTTNHFKSLTLSQTTNFRLSKLKEYADNYFEFDENGRMSSKWVGNGWEKEKIACHEQFLLFPQCFQTTCTADT